MAGEQRKKIRSFISDVKASKDFGLIEVGGLALDSREVKKGDLFFALKGAEADGKSYIEEALAKGAVAVISDSMSESLKDAPIFVVEGLRNKLGMYAARFFDEPSKKVNVIGVTGTNGKSSCVKMISELYRHMGITSAEIGTLGFRFTDGVPVSTGLTTPDAIRLQSIFSQAYNGGVETIALEVSSIGVVQGRVQGTEFSTLVFTNLSQDHLDFHGTMAAYGDAKEQLFRDYEYRNAVVNIDDERGLKIARYLRSIGKEFISCSLAAASDSLVLAEDEHRLVASHVKYSKEGMTADIRYIKAGAESQEQALLNSSLVGEFNLYNLMESVGVLLLEGFDFSKLLHAAAGLQAPRGRMQRVSQVGSDIDVYVDYAHTPQALDLALRSLTAQGYKNIVVVFGCGGDRDKSKRPLMGEVADKHASNIILTNDNPRSEDPHLILEDIKQGIKNGPFEILLDREKAISQAISQAFELRGKQHENFSCVLIAGKGHEQYQLMGNKKIDFDDADVARRCMSLLDKGGLH